MRPDQRPRTGQRRDGGVRPIRSRDVRYPGSNVDIAEMSGSPGYGERSRGTRRLGPTRDTGLAVEGRIARERRRRTAARRRNMTFAIVAIVALSSLALGWRYNSDRAAARHPLGDATATVTPASSVSAGHSEPIAEMRAASTNREPQPIFAYYKSLQLRLPVPVDELTEVGFHQASYTYALHLKTMLPDADAVAAKKAKTTGRTAEQRTRGTSAVLGGSVLRMWRSRPGKPDSAVDVGAKAGTTVVSPVNGTVIKVKRYKLYGRIDDYELHIQPDGWSDVDLVMIHITDLTVNVGDQVRAGVTPLAHVRLLHDRVHHQLGDYSKGGGDHVHFQLNNAKDPQYKGLQGAVLPDGS